MFFVDENIGSKKVVATDAWKGAKTGARKLKKCEKLNGRWKVKWLAKSS